MSDQKNTPGAASPPPEKEGTPGAFPDLSAHSDSPAWLSADGSHDTGVWERSFDGVAGGDATPAAGDADSAVDTSPGAVPGGDPAAASDLPAEPAVVAPEDLKLEEPTLAEPALSDEAVEAAALDQIASETAAAEADAAEAGRLSGLEPAPAGAEIRVTQDGGQPHAPEALAESREPADAGPDKDPTPAPAPDAEKEQPTQDPEPHPLHGIDAAAPMTDVPAPPPADTDIPREPEAATAAAPSGETRRSRRLAESRRAAGASAASSPGTAADNAAAGPRSDRRDAAPGATAADPAAAGRKSGRNTRLLLVLGGVVLAAVIAILLFVFVFNGKEEGVISEDVSPLELESGACLQDWDDVNSSATVVTCDTPHNAQLVATESLPEDADFPGTEALEEQVNEVCAAVDYTDAAADLPDLTLTKSLPTEQTWATGDRRVDCFVFAPEDQELTESLVQE
ncbi:septum formation family protein [Arthrobacter zhaoxinii]|uniref:Septum formation family protein n=1 Tax=Arthrobacter zhaoxinii TaxID=2964616 RepID=A0ABY5YQW1_9MICC|nr:septum formation family protein [Arthrobacter zhaoxinii]UWX96704.1 septum formation family protein [Arthrobacter zhaoxinii]